MQPTLLSIRITEKGAHIRTKNTRGKVDRLTVTSTPDKLAQWEKICDALDKLVKRKGLAFVSSDVFALCVLCPHAHLFAVM